jgi:hypothetical protein
MTSLKTAEDLARCLSAAQADAERFYGDGPVPRWQPARAWTSWLAVAVLVAAAASTLAWLWRASEPPRVAVVASAGAAAAPIAVPAVEVRAATPDDRGEPGCSDSTCAPALSPSSMSAEPVAGSPPWDGTDADAWALDPQSFAVSMALAGAAPHRLHNTPVIVDDVEAPAEAVEDGADQGGGSDE